MSLVSMTGFGRATAELGPSSGSVSEGQASEGLVSEGRGTLEVEIRSLNHRFLDINWRLPTLYTRFESQLAPLVRKYALRGRIDVFVHRKMETRAPGEVTLHEGTFRSAVERIRDALERAGVVEQTIWEQSVVRLFDRREILDLSASDVDATDEFDILRNTVCAALEDFRQMRLQEGRMLSKKILSHLQELRRLHLALKQEAESLPAEQQQRLRERVERLLASQPQAGALDEGRLIQETVYLADRSDITEELQRLESHFEALQAAIEGGEGAKKVEFLLQELGREVNTSGSKSQRSTITGLVVEMKVILEKMREQTLNLE